MVRPEPPAPLLRRCILPAAARGQSLLDYLAQRFRYRSRDAWRAELQAGNVTVDGRPAVAHLRLRPGMELVCRQTEAEPPVDCDYKLLAVASDYAFLDKPAHLPMHGDGPFVRNTLIHLLRSGPLPDAELVHRLDRETSGICLVARSKAAQRLLQEAFASAAVQKEYLAIVRGDVMADFTAEAAIGHCRHSRVALRRSAAPDATSPRPACTEFTVLWRSAERSLLRCRPRSGRTHQIRVHLEQHHHALLGDKLYGRPDADYLAFVQRVKAGDYSTTAGEPARQLLHAHRLNVPAPDGSGEISCTATPPADFLAWLPTEVAAKLVQGSSPDSS